jgi:hypothetical protein
MSSRGPTSLRGLEMHWTRLRHRRPNFRQSPASRCRLLGAASPMSTIGSASAGPVHSPPRRQARVSWWSETHSATRLALGTRELNTPPSETAHILPYVCHPRLMQSGNMMGEDATLRSWSPRQTTPQGLHPKTARFPWWMEPLPAYFRFWMSSPATEHRPANRVG